MTNLKKHFSHYVPLLATLALTVAGFVLFSYEKQMLIGISAGASAFYLAWGIAHHAVHKDLSAKVIMEYLSVSILGFIIMYSVILTM